MNPHSVRVSMIMCSVALLCAGCKGIPGEPGSEAKRPSQELNFSVLYRENCAACHGENGKEGMAISLDNPVYLEMAGAEKIRQITAEGVPGSLMPPFAKSQGGMLTDQQIGIIAQGMISAWGKQESSMGRKPPEYASATPGNVAEGRKVFSNFCASCHGIDGTGVQDGKNKNGSIVDSTYLALISDQGLRSLVIAGQPLEGMPDWESGQSAHGAGAITNQQITDVVAWLGSHRTSAPGQPYKNSMD